MTYKRLFRHEYTHYRISIFLASNQIVNHSTAWFEEGICEYIGHEKEVLSPWFYKLKDFTDIDSLRTFQE